VLGGRGGRPAGDAPARPAAPGGLVLRCGEHGDERRRAGAVDAADDEPIAARRLGEADGRGARGQAPHGGAQPLGGRLLDRRQDAAGAGAGARPRLGPLPGDVALCAAASGRHLPQEALYAERILHSLPGPGLALLAVVRATGHAPAAAAAGPREGARLAAAQLRQPRRDQQPLLLRHRGACGRRATRRGLCSGCAHPQAQRGAGPTPAHPPSPPPQTLKSLLPAAASPLP
jgi:hypothetical protein